MNSRVAFVSGASRGIGKGIAKRLLEDGFVVGLGYNTNEVGVTDLSNEFAHGHPIHVDISVRSSIQAAIKAFKDIVGESIGILVNNAGIADEKDFLTITDDDWDQMLQVNLRGPFAFSQEVVPGMIENKWGRIINITSIGGQWGGFNQVHYAAAKAGLINFTRSLAKMYSGKGIASTAIAIGLVQTEMSAKELESEAGKEKVKNIPAGRLATVEEIAGTVSYLISDDAAYITGQTMNINGGMYFG